MAQRQVPAMLWHSRTEINSINKVELKGSGDIDLVKEVTVVVVVE